MNKTERKRKTVAGPEIIRAQVCAETAAFRLNEAVRRVSDNGQDTFIDKAVEALTRAADLLGYKLVKKEGE